MPICNDGKGYLCPRCKEDKYLEEGEAGNLSTGPDSIPIMYCPECDIILDEDDFIDEDEEYDKMRGN